MTSVKAKLRCRSPRRSCLFQKKSTCTRSQSLIRVTVYEVYGEEKVMRLERKTNPIFALDARLRETRSLRAFNPTKNENEERTHSNRCVRSHNGSPLVRLPRRNSRSLCRQCEKVPRSNLCSRDTIKNNAAARVHLSTNT